MLNFIYHLFIPRPVQLPDPDLIIAQQIHETRLDMLKAEKELEYWRSQVPMLAQRYSRLRSQQSGEQAV